MKSCNSFRLCVAVTAQSRYRDAHKTPCLEAVFIGLCRSRQISFSSVSACFSFFILFYILYFICPFNASHKSVPVSSPLLRPRATPPANAHRFLPSTLGWLVRATSSDSTQRQVSPDICCCQGKSGIRRKESSAARRIATAATTTFPPTRHDDTQSPSVFGTSPIF